ncbi:hypothetical protein IF188_06955 [Microbacterium sp. NEAU-LLC]|uniref:Uncharacterized protein n=1 Tax=Microbacterium helvum TaxID=2773713 RepID=A0ABR8NL88_9MICO|nr:hypothetical protein [Microbacterium helvum]MBD3941435.1 hypothetical protein [Microbacterium helvum]
MPEAERHERGSVARLHPLLTSPGNGRLCALSGRNVMSPWYESVQETLNQLTFPQTGYPNLYLNQKRLGDRFLGKLGAIDTFSKSVETTGGANAKLKAVVAEATLESARGRHATINWNLSDSLAQALVLRAYLESAGELRTEPRAAMMMDFVLVGGPGEYLES